MKRFDFGTAVNQLGLGKEVKVGEINYKRIPAWVRGQDFLELFLPHLVVIGDSREQDHWIEQACKYYGIGFQWARHDDKAGTENLKEGDYSFKVVFGNKTYNYVGLVAYERKGSVSELYGNCTGHKESGSDRARIRREFGRLKSYKKVVLMLQFGENLTDLIDLKFAYRGHGGVLAEKTTGYTIYSAVMSWKQPNDSNFDVLQSASHEKLFWLFVQDCYYYFRNELRNECWERGLIDALKGEIDD